MLTDGFVNMLKPPGMTSHDVVAWARARLEMKRIGHLGTLDPAAAGVLPLAVGRATRLSQYACGAEKAYRAEIVFGLQTDTLDAEGKIVSSEDASGITGEQLRTLLPPFLGEIEQAVPAFSAVRVGGRRLHESARAGTHIVAPPRRVTIHRLELVDFAPGRRARALVDVVCGGGTYIRALADDLGRAAGCGACLGFLVRTRAGRFELSESRTLEEVAECVAANSVEGCVLPLDWPLFDLPEVALAEVEALAFVRGNAVSAHGLATGAWGLGSAPSSRPLGPSPSVRAYDHRRTFLGLGQALPDGALRPRLVLRSESELPV